jgi:hypothetical protein
MKMVLTVIGCIALIFIAIIALSFGGIQWQKTFGVKYSDVNREVILHSRAFTKGMKDDILARMSEWRKADAEGKTAIEFTVRQMTSEFDENTLPVEMADFVKKCKYGN